MDLTQSYTHIREEIERHCREAGRDPADVQLMAVSKAQASHKVRALHSLGQRYFGENYAPELIAKQEELQDLSIQWSFIGTLQSNKIQRIVKVAHEIQTLASEKHVRYVARYARELGRTPYPVYIEVNVGEGQKAGIPLAQLQAFTAFVNAEGGDALALRGILCVPPATYADELMDEVPDLYRQLAHAASQVGDGRLSLGMSRDLRLAIHAGSHIVRIGRALLGERN